ncbi:MAG: hypothetical protein SGPRY_000881 [Prymnesium sp.]
MPAAHHHLRSALLLLAPTLLSLVAGSHQCTSYGTFPRLLGGVGLPIVAMASLLVLHCFSLPSLAASFLLNASSLQLALELAGGERRIATRIAVLSSALALPPPDSSLSQTLRIVVPSLLLPLLLSARTLSSRLLTRRLFERVAVGSTNPCKVSAVHRAISSFPATADARSIRGFSVSSCVSEQPIGMEETARGARNRAEQAHTAAGGGASVLGLGIESGLFAIDGRHYDVHRAPAITPRACLTLSRLG